MEFLLILVTTFFGLQAAWLFWSFRDFNGGAVKAWPTFFEFLKLMTTNFLRLTLLKPTISFQEAYPHYFPEYNQLVFNCQKGQNGPSKLFHVGNVLFGTGEEKRKRSKHLVELYAITGKTTIEMVGCKKVRYELIVKPTANSGLREYDYISLYCARS